VAPIVDEMRENRLRWLEHVSKRKETKTAKVTKEMEVEGRGTRKA